MRTSATITPVVESSSDGRHACMICRQNGKADQVRN